MITYVYVHDWLYIAYSLKFQVLLVGVVIKKKKKNTINVYRVITLYHKIYSLPVARPTYKQSLQLKNF